ncbi:hypothetical protein A1O3_05695 [Capronia epimyces CBS 606.96]|uniref:Beta-lactamase-related domain-containing protein n=1 Tax=Capronia epimyces CBS 606.96 TaxID=1182542 RepID=W9Y5W5_9EURO|nr:uncharacterized protein A1O3_05695 [Capronia epimyces CBS 606.96]EXJ85020.1 hypothetical protein A1O3_05695 [Capronia epimyces CBS 606.96]
MQLRNMEEVAQRLEHLKARLIKVCEISGIPGCSIGVIHHGETVWKANLGYRDVERQLSPQSDTMFNLDSCTKAITAAGLGCLVADGKVQWTTPVRDILPEFGALGDIIDSLITPLDLLSMRSGHTMLDSLSWQGNNHIFFDKADTVTLWNATPRLGSFRSSYIYNNWGYAIIGIVIETLSGKKLHDFLKEKFFDPLHLSRTKMTDFTPDDNSSLCYAVLDDMTPVTIPAPAIGNNVFMEGASGLLSTIDDLMVLYSSFVTAINDQLARQSNSTKDNPFKECGTLIKGHSFLENSMVLREQSYGCGWIRCELPGPLGMISMNPTLVSMPEAAKGSPSHLCIYHQGLMPGSSANVALLPETETVVAVLANSSPLGDGADWLSQMILEEVLESPVRHNYEDLARQAASKVFDHIPSMHRTQESSRKLGTKPSLGLKDYAGRYLHNTTGFWIEIKAQGEALSIAFMGLGIETYELRHYEHDTFSWLMSYNDAARRGRFVHYYNSEHFLIRFEGVDRGIDRFYWHASRDTGPEPYLFLKAQV